MSNLHLLKHLRGFKLLSIVLALAIILIMVSGSGSTPAHAVGTLPQLYVQGNLIKDAATGGNTVVLRGVDVPDPGSMDIGHAANGTSHMMIDRAANMYARVLRIYVAPDPIDQSPGFGTTAAAHDSYFNTYLDPAVQYCISKMMYCIVDWHYVASITSTTDANTVAFWTYMAPKYANNPNVIYEIYNEPINTATNGPALTWAQYKTYAQNYINIIRNGGATNNLILVGAPSWSQIGYNAGGSTDPVTSTVYPADPLTGSNLVYVVHIYPCHGTAACNPGYTLQQIWDFWLGTPSLHVPMFVTEWGYQSGGATPTNGTQSGWGNAFQTYVDSKGVSWSAWVYDPYYQSVMTDANWNLLGGDGNMGIFVKDWLYAKRCLNQPNATCQPDLPQLKVQIEKGTTNIGDDTSHTAFFMRLWNTSNADIAAGTISVRIYYTADGTNTCSSYGMNANYQPQGAATIGAPVTVSGTSCYFPLTYSAAMPVKAGWEFQGDIHGPAGTFNGANDWFHTGYAVGSLPTLYTDQADIPAYISGTKVWGNEPGTGPTNTPTNTPTRTNTPVATNTPTNTATKTNTPVGPTNTPTSTPTRTNTPVGPTNTPTNTPTAGASTLKVQYKVGDSGLPADNAIKPHFMIVNTGATAVALSTLKIRYYFTKETGATTFTTYIDYSQIPSANITVTINALSPIKTGADYYEEVSFSTAAGNLNANSNSGEIQTRFNKTDWTNFSETDDYSYDSTKTAYTDWTKVVLLQNGTVVWGTAP